MSQFIKCLDCGHVGTLKLLNLDGILCAVCKNCNSLNVEED